MKKVNKYLMMGICGLFLIPCVTNAASISLGTSTANNNVVTVPMTLKVEETDQFNQIKIGSCDTGNDSVLCSFSKGNDSGIMLNDNLFVNANGNFTAGTYNIGNVVLTNKGSAKQTGVVVTLDSIKALSNGTEISSIEKATRSGFEIKSAEVEKKTTSDAKLSSLEFSQGTMSPVFNATTNDYVIYGISDTVSSIRVKEFKCNDGTEDCEIEVSGGKSVANKTVSLNQGKNDVKVIVTSGDGTSNNTYNFTIYRGETGYNSSKLASLSIGEYALTPAFDSKTYEYSITVPKNVNSIDALLKYTLEDSSLSSDKVKKEGTDNFKDGENIVKITVENAEGKEKSIYTIKVLRQEDESIKMLSYFKGEKVVFYDGTGEKKELKEEEFKTSYPDEWKKIEDGTYKFDEEGNLITEATEVVEKKEEKKSKTWLIVLLIVLGLIIIGVAGFFIFRKKPTDKNKKNKKEEKKEKEIDEIEVVEEKENEEEDKTVDIDEALSDLLDTKQYDFEDKE